MLNKEKEKKEPNKWISFTEAKIYQELQNQMHNEWIKTFGCSNPDCVICNSVKNDI